MPKILVVANETLGGRSLIETTKERAAALGDPEVLVIAPQNRPRAGNVIYDEAVRDAAQHRVDATISALREVGVHATGEVMDPDPFTAVMDAVGEFQPDEIVISTHPETRSGWLRRDLVERVAGRGRTCPSTTSSSISTPTASIRRTPWWSPTRRSPAPRSSVCSRARRRRSAVASPSIVPQEGGHGHHAEAARERLEETLDHMREGGPGGDRRHRRPGPVHRDHERAAVLPRRRDRHLHASGDPLGLAALRPHRACPAGDGRPGRARRVRRQGARGVADLMEAASVAHLEHDHHGPPEAHRSSRVEPQFLGMLLFIISEIMVFAAFFTAYFFIRVVNERRLARGRRRSSRRRSPASTPRSCSRRRSRCTGRCTR